MQLKVTIGGEKSTNAAEIYGREKVLQIKVKDESLTAMDAGICKNGVSISEAVGETMLNPQIMLNLKQAAGK